MASFDELKKMLDHAPCGIGLFQYGGNGASSYLNETYYRLIGYTPEEYASLRESPIEALVYPEDLPIIQAQKAEMPKVRHGESEYRIVRKNGEIRWIKQSASEMTVDGQLLAFNTFVDITKEKSIATRMNLIADHVGSSISIIQVKDATETPLYANEMFYRMIGVSEKEYATDPRGHNRRMIPPEDWIRVEEAVRCAMLSNKNGSVDYWLHRPDGSKIYVHRDFSIMQEDGNGAFLMLSIATDMTQKRQAEELLEKERSRYRLALEQTNAAIFEWDCQTHAFYCSESYNNYALSRCDNQAILHNEGSTDVVHPDDIPVLRKFFAGAGNPDEAHECTLRMKMMDGSYRWSRLSGQQTYGKHGEPLRAIGVIMDIHEEMERSLMMNALVGALPGCIGIFKFKPEMQCLYLNQGPFKEKGRSDEQVQAVFDAPNSVERLIFAPDRDVYEREVLKKVSAGERINCNYRYYKSAFSPSQEIGWIHLSAVKIREEKGCPVYYCIMEEPSNESKIFKQISEHSLVAELAVENPSGKILYANRAFCQLDHFVADKTMIGCECSDILPKADAAVLKQFIESFDAKDFAEMEAWTSCGKYLKIQAHPLDWNGKNALMLYLSDQTAVKQSNERLAKIINSVPSGIGIYELRDGKLLQLYMNDAFHRILHDTRKNREKYTGEHYLKAVHPDDVPAFEKEIARAVHGADTIQATCRVIDGEGNWVWFRVDGNLEIGEENRKIFYCSFFDVDEQVKTRLALEREQATLKLAMQAGKMSSWVYEVQDGHIYEAGGSNLSQTCGKKIEEMIDVLRKGIFVHPDSRGDYQELLQNSPHSDDVKQADLRVKIPGTSDYCWQHVVITPIFDEHGKHIRSIGTAVDVTQRKNNEQEYHRQIQELSTVNSADLVAKGFYNLTRNRVESYHAHTHNAVPISDTASYDDGVKGTAERFFKESDAENFRMQFDRRQLLSDYASGETETSIEYQRKAEDGTIFWARTQSKMAIEPNSKDVLCFIYTYDINTQKIAQETISTVIRLDYDYFAVLDCHTNSYVLYASTAGDKETQLPPQRSLDYEKSVRDYAEKYVVPENMAQNIHDMSIRNICEKLQTQESFVSYATITEMDGKPHRKTLRFSYLDRENQQVLITRMDITNIYAQEQQRLTEQQKAAQALQQANRVKTEFLARMSHDLRTPMNAVIGLTALARDEVNDPKAIKHYLSNIASAGNFLLGLVNDCLDFEKMTENRMELHPTVHPYATFRENICSIIDPLCAKKNITFVFPKKESPYVIVVDGVRLEQIFINLLTNAVKFTPEGGKVEFLVSSTCSQARVCSSTFVVRDNGVGMSREFQQRMFEPFEQEDNEAVPQSQGTGLGLSIVKNLVELMGGSISAKSEQGRGTEFTVHLDMPLADPAYHAAPKKRVNLSASLENLRILLVEDHPLNTEIARKLLEKKGACVTCAENGKVALELFRQAEPFAFDAVLMDIRMPVMNGLDAARAIRALDREDAQKVPIIAMTANAFDEDVQATKKAGMNAHLSKPIEPDQLYSALESLTSQLAKTT